MWFIDRSRGNCVDLALQGLCVSTPGTKELRRIAAESGYGYDGIIKSVAPLPGEDREFRLEIFRLIRSGIIQVPIEGNESWDAVAFFHPNGASLVSVAREFKALNKCLLTPESMLCYPVSLDFENLLRDRGVVSEAQIRNGEVKVVFGPYHSDWHAWNKVGNIGIDWTFGQFAKGGPCPYLFHIRETHYNEQRRRYEYRCESAHGSFFHHFSEWRVAGTFGPTAP